MNPLDADEYYKEYIRTSQKYEHTFEITADQSGYKRLINMIAPPVSDMITREYVEQYRGNPFATTSTHKNDEAVEPTPDEPYDNANVIRDIDYTNFTEEELNSAIDHLHEVLLKKRHESLLDLDPSINKDD